MSVLTKIDHALLDARQQADEVTFEKEFVIILNADIRNEFMREMLKFSTRPGSLMPPTYRGARLATDVGEHAKPIEVYYRRKKSPWCLTCLSA